MWVASKISGAAGALGADVIELRNWLLRFGCAYEELRDIVARLIDWMANSSPPWAAYTTIMKCLLGALDKQPGVRPVGIGETLCRALDKLIMRAAGDQVKTACRNLQLCAGLKAVIEGATHAVGKQQLGRVWGRRCEEEEDDDSAEEEEECGVVVQAINNLSIEGSSSPSWQTGWLTPPPLGPPIAH